MEEEKRSSAMVTCRTPDQLGEVVTVNAGEAGIQLGIASWELYCIEHGIGPDGLLCNEQDSNALATFFSLTSTGKCVPRAVFADTDSCILDEVRTGAFRYLYNPRQLISGKEDAANCFAKGYLTLGREMVDAVLDRVRMSTEECSRLQGFMIYRGVGGGTGSGMMCYLLEQFADDYKKTGRIDISVYPAPKLSSIIVEPYNAILATHSSMSTISCCLPFENDSVYEICDRELKVAGPGFQSINRVASQVLSAITAQFRIEGDATVNLKEFQTNLVPYPRIHFPIIGYAPFVRANKAQYEDFTVASITNACFEPINQMVKCNSKSGKYISCCFLYRGDISTAEINATLSSLKMKKSIKFVGWLPTRFKIGVNFMPPVAVPSGDMAPVNRACAMIANNTAVRSAWEKLNRKFDLLYAKKAFIHWYIAEGLEESDFLDARMDMQALVSDYKEVESEL